MRHTTARITSIAPDRRDCTRLWVVGLAGVALNLYAGVGFARAASGLVGLVILYWLLQIGGEKSGWSRLR